MPSVNTFNIWGNKPTVRVNSSSPRTLLDGSFPIHCRTRKTRKLKTANWTVIPAKMDYKTKSPKSPIDTVYRNKKKL